MEQPTSNLFEGYKSVGHITGPLPFIVRHGKNPQDTRIITIIGKTFHTYTTNLSLVEVSIPHESPIRCLISDEQYIYSASGRSIFCWARGSKHLKVRLDRGHQADVHILSKFGNDRILAVDEDNNIFSWNIKDKEILNKINFDEGVLKITAILNPMRYKDKALIGSKQGRLQLWNVAKEECLYTFKGWDEAGVSCLTQSPVEDVVAIGLDDGHVYVHNIKYDEVVMKIYQEYGAITSMSFRLDDQPYLVTASEVGHLMIWNLERKRLSSQIRNAHSGSISKCQFIRNQSLLVTGGADNCLKVWTMDMSDGSGNLLHQRAGHSAPPNQIQFYGQKGFNLLSAGKDSTIKMFHLYSERMNRNLGTARLNPKSKNKQYHSDNKLSPIVCFAAETAKEKQWDNIAACHENSSLVTTWNYDKCRMGEHIISQPTFEKHDVTATCICITGCGNFLVIGFSNGLIFKYNMQSGIFRQYYEDSELTEHRAHDGPVTSLAVDGLDLVLVSTSSDSKMKVWNFKSGSLLMNNKFESPIKLMKFHRENNLVAVGLENNQIEIMDLETKTLIRKFTLESCKLLDMTFSPDSRWLIASYDDCSIRTWDLQLGKLIDAFRLSSPCISLSISSTGEFLATAHSDSLGVNIWCNYTIYCPTALRAIDPEQTPTMIDMPYVRCDEQPSSEEQESEDQALPEVGETIDLNYVSPEQLNENLITISGLPSSRWKNLLHVDEIRERQKIDDEERRGQKPIKVPFFIPVKDGLKPTLDGEALKEFNEKDQGQSSTSLSKVRELQLLSPLSQCLVKSNQTSDYKLFFEQLKEMGPSATDAEIRSMGKDTCGNNRVMLCFLDAIEQLIRENKDYELVSAWLALFLKVHSDIIQSDAEVKLRCQELKDPVSCQWDRLNEKFNQIFSVLNFIRTSIL